jgi:hypothetical protein
MSSEIDTDHNVLDEIKYIQQLMRDNGEQGDFGIQIKFGELIRVSIENRIHVELFSKIPGFLVEIQCIRNLDCTQCHCILQFFCMLYTYVFVLTDIIICFSF